mmetsp:Transcript_13848/g.18076  ORF Transcript_13848/g.18076 Transcript_13848/m.18076 type:complete len:194 (-) Transcript_13848:220-801(-)|eukprot:CAMPEP_0198148050 /NCGR_PEP_ID=MMETSP1443-20131203/39487_1 /TAXON_ID=186043 /ORGANISM="Entomoneis sp., Strain CCMP2396" /LENGTH=193 /DNA_ID=CAMNT_0043812619 /DNA_START=23 /DNA_END=604 /DNA_ORIENTATION=+
MPSSSKTSGHGTAKGKAGSKRRLDFEDIASASIGATVTRSKTRQKRGHHQQQPISFPPSSSPTPSQKHHKSAVVTPGDADGEHTKESKKDSFVPVYIHKNLVYHTEGSSNLSEKKKQAFALICKTHLIPSDLESSRAHGPLSGSTYEEKVLEKYTLEQLQPKPGFEDDPTATKICIACADQGHIRDDCPTLLL